MEDVFREAQNLLSNGRPFVIATVVGTKGSTPQKPGAKLLVREDGSGVGTLGGGCVEGDIWFAAKMLLRDGGGPTITDYELNEDIAAREGLVCGGTMYFLIDPVLEPETVQPTVSSIVDAYDGSPSVGVGHPAEAREGHGADWRQDLHRTLTARPGAPWAIRHATQRPSRPSASSSTTAASSR